MDLKEMDFWDKEEIELGLKLCCSNLKKETRSSCSLDLFNKSSCEIVYGIPESLGNSNNSGSVSADVSADADPEGEMKEQDLIKSLMKSYSSSNSIYNSLVSFNSDVDFTLSLGMPHSWPSPEEQRVMDMYRTSSMEEVKEIMKSTLFPPKITSSKLEDSAVPFDESYNISSSGGSTTTNAISISWFPTTNSGSKFMEAMQAKPKKTSRNNPMNSNSNENVTQDGATRWCSTCNTTITPLWRSGPKGAKSLCNACGIRYKKEERRSASAMAVEPEENNQFVKASCSNPIQDHNNKITAASCLQPCKKKIKLQPISAEEFPLLSATFEDLN